jgi:broad specificity polyphosphatase/5'/3'-nucleotidase SurE
LQEGAYNWDACCHYAEIVVERALKMEEERRKHPEWELRIGDAQPFLLNLNIPALPLDKIKGLKITNHGASGFAEYYEPHEREENHFNVNGIFTYDDPHKDYDAPSLVNGYASLTPLKLDLTDIHTRKKLNTEWDDICINE